MQSTKELKRQASLDKRRRRNREAMQRARQRDKDNMEALRQEARSLEETHRQLLSQVDQSLSRISVSAAPTDRIADLQRRLEDTREQANKLMRQNLKFQQEMGERVKGEDRMEGLLEEMAREQQAQERVYRQLCRESPVDPTVQNGFSADRIDEIILNSRRERTLVDKVGFADTQRVYLFGWTTLHRFKDDKLYFSFKKIFRKRSATHLVDRNWANEIKFVTYRSASEAATQQFHVVQKFNDDTYLIAREKVDPDGEEKVVRLLYLRFRLFEANGCYAIVTQSVPQDPVRYGGSLEKIWANDAWDPRSVRANVLETVMGLLRWENINVGPTLSLTQASTAENTPPEQAEGKRMCVESTI
ncbi:Avirulence protein (Avh) [Phytophthora cinnamomi]|uniref:Avirulence protein (Avh) n=1 Tax=Phytophthora cinnamomi TaxID=4785 RepID=UPI00355A8453|nr:Avirulence protein (Avh) [Phytophthora cinnamomi]